jgi:hypothetical protein
MCFRSLAIDARRLFEYMCSIMRENAGMRHSDQTDVVFDLKWPWSVAAQIEAQVAAVCCVCTSSHVNHREYLMQALFANLRVKN